MSLGQIPNLVNYRDFIKKSRYDFERFCKAENTYNFLDCVLTLNAIPEWIRGSEAPPDLQRVANEKFTLMKEAKDVALKQLESIDEKLAVIRLISNHGKHKATVSFPEIRTESGAAYPIVYPAPYQHISIGSKTITAKALLLDVITFWEEQSE